MLTPDEMERAARFRFDADRSRYARARAALRTLLGWYVNERPEALHIAYGSHGKPYAPAYQVEFSTSHAADRVVYALATDRAVGVDIDRIEPGLPQSDLATQIVAPHDYVLDDAPAITDLTVADLVTLWVKKEAAAKALGVGLSVEPRDILVPSLRHGLHHAVVPTGGGEHATVAVRAFDAARGFASAAAARGSDWTLRVDELPAWVSECANCDGRA